MAGFKEKLKPAFAVDPEPAGRGDDLPEPLERLAQSLVDRGMETPAIILLESIRPLSFLTGQAMIAVWPLIKMASDWDDYKEVADSLEDRHVLGNLVNRIEELSHQRAN